MAKDEGRRTNERRQDLHKLEEKTTEAVRLRVKIDHFLHNDTRTRMLYSVWNRLLKRDVFDLP